MGDADEFLRRMGIPRHDELDDAEELAVANADSAGHSEHETADEDDPASLAEEFRELQHEAAELQRQLSVSQEGVGDGGDGSIQVTVGSDGRVNDVRIARTWQRRIAPEEFDSAVLEAVTDAVMKRMEAWTEAVTDGDQPESDSADPGSSVPEPPAPAAHSAGERLRDGAQAREFRQEMHSLLDGVEHELDALQQRVSQVGQCPVEGRSPSHQVIASVNAWGQVTAITTRSALLEKASAHALGQEILAALQDAYERAGKATTSSLLGDGKLARIYELVNDHEELARRFGLDSR